LVAVLVFLAAVSAQAETVLMKNQDGVVRSTEQEETWNHLSTKEQEACANPGKEITLASRITEWKRVDFLHVAPIRHSTVVVFSDGRLQTMDRIAEDGSDERFSHAFFCLIALGCMIVSNLLVIVLPRVKSVAVVVVAVAAAVVVAAVAAAVVVAAVAAFAAAFVTAVVVAAFAAAFVTAVVVVAVAVVTPNEWKVYITCSAFFYIFLVLALFL
jgi:hypothetical protein